ncbi:formyltransferase family protein [Aeromonas veronii]|uniref:formyltransferase family protein n=1 Tax=Aeromonas veronii TaxID=654 RepID=UPI002B48C4BD|nr:formyltransferase family protein [Aeromonas veronii]
MSCDRSVVVAGKNNIAVDVVDHIRGHYPGVSIQAVINSTDKGVDGFQRSFKKYCQSNDVKIIELSEAYEIDDLVFLSLEFDKIINPSLFKSTQLYNIHFSKLPAYKGMYTSAWPIINGEAETGVTLHKIDSGIDTGDIMAQSVFELSEDETAASLYQKYISFGTDLVISKLDALFYDNIACVRQQAKGSSYYSKKSIDYSNVIIDLNKTAIEIKNSINAFTFRTYQLPRVFGHHVCGCEILDTKSVPKAGTILEETEQYIILSSVDFDVKVYKDTFSLLMQSCSKNDVELVRAYLNKFNVNEKNDKGWSPIIVAAYNGQLNVIRQLLECGANINDTNYNGTTVFMYAKDYAIEHNSVKYLEELKSLGADLSLSDYRGMTVFDYLKNQKNEYWLSVLSSL